MIALVRGPASLRIDEERGGRLSSLALDGSEILIGPPDPDDWSIHWGCFVMAPWVGRIEHGRLEWDGVSRQLPLTEGGHALHGLVYDRRWEIQDATRTSVALTCRIGSSDWPSAAVVRQRLALEEDHLEATLEIVADGPMPAALGWHPWFRRNGDARVRLDAPETLETRDLIPTGRRLGVDELTDLRDGEELGDRALDHVYPDAPSPAIITWPFAELRLEWEGPIRAVVVHSTPDAFCVEPQTAWPNAIALAARGSDDAGQATLGAGDSLAATMRWRWELR